MSTASPDKTRTESPTTWMTRGRVMTAIAICVIAMNPAQASAQEDVCITFSLDEATSSLWTWGDYDLWALEADGARFEFSHPGIGTQLTTGNGADIEIVHKCTLAPEPEPTALPTPTVAPTATPDPTPTVAPTATPDPTPTRRPAIPVVPTATPTPTATAERGLEDPTIGGSSPDPLTTQPASSRSIVLPPPLFTGDAQVLGLQLAKTGPAHVALLSGFGAAISALGLGLMSASRRFRLRAQTTN